MAEDTQKLLDEILASLQSNDSTRQVEAMYALEKLRDGSQAIFFELERLAIRGTDDVRAAALEVLRSETGQYIASRLSGLSRNDRLTVLKEIQAWEENGLIEPHRAEVLSGRYDFETKARPSPKPMPQATPNEA